MVSIKLSTTIDLGDLSKKINEFAEDIERPSELMRLIGRYMQRSTKLNFDRQRSPFGEAWTPSLAAIRAGRKTLIKTGTLKKSIKYNSDDSSVSVGSNVEYGKFHQLGTSKLPKRQFIGLSNDDIDVISNLIDEQLEREFDKNF